MESSQQEGDQLQKEANDIMKELLKTPQQGHEHQETHYQPTKATTLTRQLFIGNLPFRVRWQDIKDLFRKAGPVLRADVALNHHDNRSKGHGTVLFATVSDAQNAIDMFNGYKWLGRILEVRGDRGFVDHAQQQDTAVDSSTVTRTTVATTSPKTEKESVVGEQLVTPSLSAATVATSPTKKRQPKDADEDDQCKQIFVGNDNHHQQLPFNCQWQDLKDLFRHSGRIIRADVVLNFEGRSRGFGTVLFSSHEDAKKAIEKFNGYDYNNRILRVHFDKFAASHQRFREHEAETYGQRQIHDPASVELLRQTYLPQQTAYQNMMGGFINPSLLIPMQTTSYPYQSSPQQQYQQYQQHPFTDPAFSHDTAETAKSKASPTPSAMYNTYSTLSNTLNNPVGSQSQQQYQNNPFSLISSSYTPSAYSSSMINDNRQADADAYGNPMAFNPYPYLTHQWLPPHNAAEPTLQHYYPSYSHQQEAETEQETLSSTLERISLSNSEIDSAGLNKNDASLRNSPS
ncbi:RNA-binding domain-containing protein [Mucor ambiguus]|uniref:RNA-binding domain-containing protein n=1 Tax=Mucor ambiguus TaxID=91626 RepID=A0A0C9M0M1_9FUNG|nr:RNA-binding domain-containing protein [Mucor ambiguus]